MSRQVVSASLGLALVLAACLTIPAQIVAADGQAMPPAEAEALWTYISQTSPYTQWGFWPDHQGMRPGRSPHGPKHKVFVNEAGLTSTAPPANHGTIEVKESYTEDEKLANLTVQYKVEGFNPANGDWFWAKYAPDGRVQAAGKLNGCIRCHGVRADNDYIIVHDFK